MKVLSALRWFASVGLKVFRVVPWATSLGVVCTLVSQVASLLAALLPLKVIILLGSDRIPSYFPDLLQVYGRTVLIVGLGGATLVFFAIHLLAEWSISRLSAFGARELIANSRKLALFENQELLLTKAYQRFAEALAGGVFLGLAGLALARVYPLQAIAVGSYIIIVWVVLVIIQRLGHVWREQQVGEFIRLVGVLANVGFFVVFSAIVFDVLTGTKVSVFWAIVTLLLVRQLFRRLTSLVGDIANLYSQRLQLNALLFHGHLYAGRVTSEDASGLWALADPETYTDWLVPLVERISGPLKVPIEVRWVQSGIPDLLTGIIHIGNESKHCYLIKLYGENRSSLARHEASLFGNVGEASIPLPRIRLVEQVASFTCHLFDWSLVDKVTLREAKVAAMKVTEGLFNSRPSASLVAIYARSRPMLWQRLHDTPLERLRFFACDSETFSLHRFAKLLTAIKSRLEAMPLAIVAPDLPQDALWMDRHGVVSASQWAFWTLEPVGAGWPTNAQSLPLLPEAFEQAQRLRTDLNVISVKHAELAALMFAFDKACQRQAYRTAIELIEPILSAYDGIGGQTSKG
ncbi:hypothetical protein [Stutzerimonas stutzeri]|uniref:hypothetical protein n=1 Tax=Stutzerimonas stutzeri TaxID=316 RepID=UPI002109C775|nr:hypothetical protein [Stutzerimonas stutzeri]MCQ4239546.1 hypothetical protein [Stutzerimonas stutzeri]